MQQKCSLCIVFVVSVPTTEHTYIYLCIVRGISYRWNKKAWMTGSLFDDWLHEFDRSMKNSKRNVLLLLDNAPSHILPGNLTNTEVHFLPPCTTSKLQPMDAGIINSFKRQYRTLQVNEMVRQSDSSEEALFISVRHAIRFTAEAWNNVSTDTISNCWKHTSIIAKPQDQLQQLPVTPTNEEMPNIFDRIYGLLNIAEADRLSFSDFVNCDDHVILDEENDEEVNVEANTDVIEEADIEVAPNPPTYNECGEYLEKILLFFESRGCSQKELNTISSLKRSLHTYKCEKQKSILDYFHK